MCKNWVIPKQAIVAKLHKINEERNEIDVTSLVFVVVFYTCLVTSIFSSKGAKVALSPFIFKSF